MSENYAPAAQATQASTPKLAAGPRIDALDLLRGIAILGIFLMNTWTMSLPQETYTNPATYNPEWVPGFGFPVGTDPFTDTTNYVDLKPLEGLNHWVYVGIHLFADMKFISTFSVLFGAGIVLQAERSRKKGNNPWTTHYLRMAVLLCFGLVHTFGFWYGDILTDYALCGFLLAPFRLLPAWLLLLMGVCMVAVPTGEEIARQEHQRVLAHGTEAEIKAAEKWFAPIDEVDSWERGLYYYSQEVFNLHWREKGFENPAAEFPTENDRELATYQQGSWWDEVMGHRFWCSIIDHTTGLLTWTFWRCGGCFLIGMALQKRKFFHGAWSIGAYASIASVVIPVGWIITYMGVMFNRNNGWIDDFNNPNSVFRMGSLFNYWGSLLCCFGYMSVGVLLATLAAKAPVKGRVFVWLEQLKLKPTLVLMGLALALHGIAWMLSFVPTESWPLSILLKTLGVSSILLFVIATTSLINHSPVHKIFCACLLPLRSIGRMALTCYLTETLIGTTFYYGHGFGNFGKTTRAQNLLLVFPTWIFLMIFASLWLMVFRQGPLEWFWHSIVYWDWKNPLKSAAGPDASLSPYGKRTGGFPVEPG